MTWDALISLSYTWLYNYSACKWDHQILPGHVDEHSVKLYAPHSEGEKVYSKKLLSGLYTDSICSLFLATAL